MYSTICFGRVPDAKVLAKSGIEGFKEGLVEVGNGFIFTEGIEEGGLDAVERFASEVEYLLELDGIERAGLGHLAKELAKDRDAQIIGGDAPVEARARCASFGCATPENPGGEDSVKERLNESGTKKVLAFLAFELDAERFLEGNFDGAKLPRG